MSFLVDDMSFSLGCERIYHGTQYALFFVRCCAALFVFFSVVRYIYGLFCGCFFSFVWVAMRVLGLEVICVCSEGAALSSTQELTNGGGWVPYRASGLIIGVFTGLPKAAQVGCRGVA